MPYFLELPTYRWREHCGPGYDNDIGYRSDLEFEFWKQKDPIESLSQQLDSDQVKEVINEIRDEIEAAFVFAENSSFAPSSAASENVYESTSATHEESHLHSCSQRISLLKQFVSHKILL